MPGKQLALQQAKFRPDHAIAHALTVLSWPSKRAGTTRPDPLSPGLVVVRFALPLEFCPTTNAMMRLHFAQQTKLQHECMLRMLGQHGRRSEPLPGRPRVNCVRFSSSAADPDSSWCKVPVDRLQVGKPGHRELGFIRDDSSEAIDLRCWCEPAKRGEGFVLIEVRSETK